jgi:hypothetical protein
MSLGRFITVYEVDGDTLAIESTYESELDAAYTGWVERGIDRVLRLTQIHGDEFVMRASQILSYAISTPEGREKHTSLEKVAKDERKGNRQTAGLPWEDDA